MVSGGSVNDDHSAHAQRAAFSDTTELRQQRFFAPEIVEVASMPRTMQEALNR
jgi:hypothetical protein